MEFGTIKWFSKAKGYGFIRQLGQKKDIFIHYSKVQTRDYRALKARQKVWFLAKQGQKGEYATLLIPAFNTMD